MILFFVLAALFAFSVYTFIKCPEKWPGGIITIGLLFTFATLVAFYLGAKPSTY